jgi:hypothetical protein
MQSDPEQEYREMLLKAQALRHAIAVASGASGTSLHESAAPAPVGVAAR